MHTYDFVSGFIMDGTAEMFANYHSNGTVIASIAHERHEIQLVLETKNEKHFAVYVLTQFSNERLRKTRLNLNYTKLTHPIKVEYELFRILRHVKKTSLGLNVAFREYSISNSKTFYDKQEVIYENLDKFLQKVKDPNIPLTFSIANSKDTFSVYAYYDEKSLTQDNVSKILNNMEPLLLKIIEDY
ncbi:MULTISPECIES: hypothetical protein [unclassified Exiguobacterium]|uniref:hypothetical protein n=1 Tax=unclassified Exiguobacterium TaxID=2644629 RepID=UPI001BEC98EB|nr:MULTISPECIES: hypothetical protein [unclassified Exiguobacterium]